MDRYIATVEDTVTEMFAVTTIGIGGEDTRPLAARIDFQIQMSVLDAVSTAISHLRCLLTCFLTTYFNFLTEN